MEWPKNKKFAFTIIDDTDNATVENVKPVYDLLYKLGIYTTKSIWVYPPRNSFRGQSLNDKEYLDFIRELKSRGFDIALHNVGSGEFTRTEIQEGLECFSEKTGSYPYVQINHSSNPDNLYWGNERFVFPLNKLMKLIFGKKRQFYGTDKESQFFWGDLAKKYMKFIRNHCFNGINTISRDYKMPYKVRAKEEYSNYWFSSSDGQTVEEFCALLSFDNIDLLEKQRGACIVYTHFASGFASNGKLNENFVERMNYLARKDGWFVPAGVLLGYLLDMRRNHYAGYPYLLRLDLLWLFDRIIKKIKFKR